MHNDATILFVSVMIVIPLSLVLPAKITALPSPFIIAASIVGLVAVFGAMFSLLLRKKGKTKKQ